MLSRSCPACRVLAGKLRGELKRAAKLSRCNAHNAPKNLGEMAGTRVPNVEGDLDEAARGFANELLCARDPLPRHELERRHPRALLKHARKMERAEFDDLGQFIDGNLLGELVAHIVLHFA